MLEHSVKHPFDLNGKSGARVDVQGGRLQGHPHNVATVELSRGYFSRCTRCQLHVTPMSSAATMTLTRLATRTTCQHPTRRSGWSQLRQLASVSSATETTSVSRSSDSRSDWLTPELQRADWPTPVRDRARCQHKSGDDQ